MRPFMVVALAEMTKTIRITVDRAGWITAYCRVCQDAIGGDGGILVPELHAYCGAHIPVGSDDHLFPLSQVAAMIAQKQGTRVRIERIG